MSTDFRGTQPNQTPRIGDLGEMAWLNKRDVILVKNIPTADPADGVTIWNDGGVLKCASPAS